MQWMIQLLETAHRVLRLKPSAERQMIGPFIFWDHIGPSEFVVGEGVDVRPHPHIGLATVTYLFDGKIMHRDSLGSAQAIMPGDVNWMTAGRGIAHSERTEPGWKLEPGRKIFGIQSWVALPKAAEEVNPDFFHHKVQALPPSRPKASAFVSLRDRCSGKRRR